MNKLTKVFVAAILASSAITSIASEGTYVLVEGGYNKAANKDKLVKATRDYYNNKSESTFSKEKKPGSFFFAAGVGYKFDQNFRSDLTLNFVTKSTNKTNVTSGNENGKFFKAKVGTFATLVNGYYDVTGLSDMVTPYVGAGVGVAKSSYKVTGDTSDITTTKIKTKAQFAYQVGLGTLVKVSDMADLKIGYKFNDFGKVKATVTVGSTSVKTNVRSHQVLAGVQFKI